MGLSCKAIHAASPSASNKQTQFREVAYLVPRNIKGCRNRGACRVYKVNRKAGPLLLGRRGAFKLPGQCPYISYLPFQHPWKILRQSA